MNMNMSRIPASAGSWRRERRKVTAHGRAIPVTSVVFTTHDGFVGEASVSRALPFPMAIRAAYEAAVAERAAALYRAQQAAANVLPSGQPVSKPAPFAPLLRHIKDTFLCAELESRGYEVLTT